MGSSESGEGYGADRERAADVHVDEHVDVADLRARYEDHVVGGDDDVVLGALARLHRSDVDAAADRLPVGRAPNQDDLLPMRGLREAAGLLDRLEHRETATELDDALIGHLAADEHAVADRFPH